MTRRPKATASRLGAHEIGTNKARAPLKPGSSRVEQLVVLLDHCAAAKDIADEVGEKFLSYLLSMAIQESRATMRDFSSTTHN